MLTMSNLPRWLCSLIIQNGPESWVLGIHSDNSVACVAPASARAQQGAARLVLGSVRDTCLQQGHMPTPRYVLLWPGAFPLFIAMLCSGSSFIV